MAEFVGSNWLIFLMRTRWYEVTLSGAYIHDWCMFDESVCNHDALGCVLMGGEL